MSGKISGIYVEIKGDSSQLKKDIADAKAFITQQAGGMSDALNNALSGGQIRSATNQLVGNLSQLSQASKLTGKEFANLGVDLGDLRRVTGMTESQFSSLQSKMLETRAGKAQEDALRSIAKAAGLTKDEIAALGNQMGVSSAKIASVTASIHGVDSAVQSSGKSFNILGAAASTAMGLLGAQTFLEAGFRVKEFSGDVIVAGMNMESLNLSFKEIAGSSDGAARQISKLHSISDQTGQNFYDIASGYKQMSAASKDTNLEGAVTEKLFRGITSASTVLGMTTEQTSLSIKAFTDMISKGQIQMEEVKGQLGDNLPGAVRIFSKALGIGTDEFLRLAKEGKLFADDVLPKVAEALDSTYTKAAQTAALEAGRSSVNKLSQEWTDLKTNLYDTEIAVSGIKGVTLALRELNGVIKSGAFSDTFKNPSALSGYSPVGFLLDAYQRYKIAGVGKDSSSMRQSVNRDDIQSHSFLGTWSELESKNSNVSIGTAQIVADAQKKITDEIRKGHEELLKYNQTERDRAKAAYESAVKYAQTDGERNVALAKYKETLSKIDERGSSGSNKAASAVESLNVELAKLNETNGSKAQEQIAELEKKYADFARTLGATNPKVREFREAVDRTELGLQLGDKYKLQPYQVTSLEQMNKGDMFNGMAAANKRALELMRSSTTEQDKLITEFDDKYKQIVLGEYEYKKQIIDDQAELYRKAGADEIAVAQWAAQEKLKISDKWYDGVSRGLKEYGIDSQNAAKSAESAIKQSFEGATDAMAEFVVTGKASFSDLTNSILKDLAKMAIQKSITGPLASGLSSVFSSWFNGGSSAVTEKAGTLSNIMSINAKGNVFTSPSLSAFSGGVYDSPHFFKFASGAGVFGEAGPEAIMPLRRGSDGKLGVAASGGGNVSVEVHNYGQQQATTRETTDGRGGRKIEVIIGDAVGAEVRRSGSGVNSALRQHFGASPVLTSR